MPQLSSDGLRIDGETMQDGVSRFTVQRATIVSMFEQPGAPSAPNTTYIQSLYNAVQAVGTFDDYVPLWSPNADVFTSGEAFRLSPDGLRIEGEISAFYGFEYRFAITRSFITGVFEMDGSRVGGASGSSWLGIQLRSSGEFYLDRGTMDEVVALWTAPTP